MQQHTQTEDRRDPEIRMSHHSDKIWAMCF
jgi:hypothetical protein